MKVFLSWSGKRSKAVANILREWLPSVIQSVTPYMSSEDIDKGPRWSADIAKELEESSYGIICITKENLSAPWINFEAGALSKSLQSAYVSPFLIDIKPSELQGPLVQFQATVNDKEEVAKLLKSINRRIPDANRLSDSLLDKGFNVWWPELEKNLAQIQDAPASASTAVVSYDEKSKILEELLDIARQQQRLLNDPSALLPIDHLAAAFNQKNKWEDHELRRMRFYLVKIRRIFAEFVVNLDPIIGDSAERDSLRGMLGELNDTIQFMTIDLERITGKRLGSGIPSPRHSHARVIEFDKE